MALKAAWRNAPAAHRFMLLASPGLALAFLLVRGEPAKVGVLLLGLLLVLATATTSVRQVTFAGRHRLVIVVALALALGNCGSQRWMWSNDYARTQSEISRFTCEQAQEVRVGSKVGGRGWAAGPQGTFVAHAPQAWRWIDLYLAPHQDGGYHLSAGPWTNDDVYADLHCRAASNS
jgi:hypothetical protein